MAEDEQFADDNTDVAKIPSSPSATAASRISSRTSHRLLLPDVPLPQLSGNPSDLIELDEDSDDDSGDCRQAGNTTSGQGVEQFIERMMQHALKPTGKQACKPKTVEIR